MARYILILAAVIAAPFLVWTLMRLIRGGPARPAPTTLLVTISAAGTIAALLVLGVVGLNSGSGEGAYAPPTLEDGQVRPGRFEEREDRSGDPAR
ncbi:MAG: hypothetical protein ACLFQ5_09970 [Oceanicaulis sp.]